MTEKEKVAYFNRLAPKWDSWQDEPALRERLRRVFRTATISPDEFVLDLACGTGVLTTVLLEKLSDKGRIFAVDSSSEMLAIAQRKISDPRLQWITAAADAIPLTESAVDRAVCFNAWPHFEYPKEVIGELARILRPGGFAHILHFASHDQTNAFHASKGPPIEKDFLPEPEELAAWFGEAGFIRSEIREETDLYLVSVRRGDS